MKILIVDHDQKNLADATEGVQKEVDSEPELRIVTASNVMEALSKMMRTESVMPDRRAPLVNGVISSFYMPLDDGSIEVVYRSAPYDKTPAGLIIGMWASRLGIPAVFCSIGRYHLSENEDYWLRLIINLLGFDMLYCPNQGDPAIWGDAFYRLRLRIGSRLQQAQAS